MLSYSLKSEMLSLARTSKYVNNSLKSEMLSLAPTSKNVNNTNV